MNAASRRIGLPIFGVAVAQVFGSATPKFTQAEAITDSTSNTTTSTTTTKTKPKPRLLFVGTGSSTGCPKPLCSMLFGAAAPKTIETPEIERLRLEYQDRCKTSTAATLGDPKHNKDYRNNPALLITHCPSNNNSDTDDSNDGECKNILIDAGKTFREAALRWFPEHGVASLDAIILTHHHMDAAGGLDDVRGFQKLKARGSYNKPPQMIPMPIHVSQDCLDDVSQRFPWLFPNQQAGYKTGMEGAVAVERHVASFDIQVFKSYQPMNVEGLEIIPLPVWHGDDLISYGFAFSVEGTNVLYISDVSRMVPETLEYILTKLPATDILIVDSLLPDKPHSVHFSLEQAVALSEQVSAKQTYLIGMNCDAFPSHAEVNETLQKRFGGKVLLAYDGQAIDL